MLIEDGGQYYNNNARDLMWWKSGSWVTMGSKMRPLLTLRAGAFSLPCSNGNYSSKAKALLFEGVAISHDV